MLMRALAVALLAACARAAPVARRASDAAAAAMVALRRSGAVPGMSAPVCGGHVRWPDELEGNVNLHERMHAGRCGRLGSSRAK